jgi:hypothetical protein
MENITLTPEENNDMPSLVEDTPVNIDLVKVDITDPAVALNVMIGFLNTAQKRGAFSFEESAKIWQCIQQFIQKL